MVKLVEKFDKLLINNELEELISKCRELLVVDSKSYIANLYLGEVSYKLENYAEAEKYYERALGENSNDANLLSKLGVIAFTNNILDKASNYFSRALVADANNFEVNYNYSVFLAHQKNYHLAVKFVNKCLVIDSKSIKANILLAELNLATGNYIQGISIYENIILNEGSYDLSIAERTISLIDQSNDTERLIRLYKKVIEQFPEQIKFYNRYLEILRENKLLEETIKIAEKGLEIDKENVEFLFHLAGSYLELKNYDKAYQLTTKLITLDNHPQRKIFYENVLKMIDTNLPNIDVKIGSDVVRSFNGTWYRGEHTNYQPSKQNLREDKAIEKYVLLGRIPAKPFINKKMKITTFGSCFARNVTEHLKNKGYAVLAEDMYINSHVVRCGEGMVNTYAILQQFEWAYENKKFSEELWYGSKKEIASYDEKIRETTLDIFNQTEVFIITLGLSEIWYNKNTEEVFWRAIPKDKFDSKVHGFRITSVAENKVNIIKIYKLIKKHRPQATIIFTLSPIPLNATFRPISCITANSVSKSILRAALDEVIREYENKDKKLFYYPSYEIVKDFYVDAFEEDNRHVKQEIISEIMNNFEKYFCTT